MDCDTVWLDILQATRILILSENGVSASRDLIESLVMISPRAYLLRQLIHVLPDKLVAGRMEKGRKTPWISECYKV